MGENHLYYSTVLKNVNNGNIKNTVFSAIERPPAQGQAANKAYKRGALRCLAASAAVFAATMLAAGMVSTMLPAVMAAMHGRIIIQRTGDQRRHSRIRTA